MTWIARAPHNYKVTVASPMQNPRSIMKVVRLTASTAEQALVEANAPQPRPGRGELLIRVCAAGVTPTELLWYPTSHSKTGETRTGAVPGHEFSGVIAEV